MWIPNLIVAVIFALIGVVAAEYVANQIRYIKGKGTDTIAGFARVIILVFVAVIALQQIGINVELAGQTLLIIVAGVMFGLALAFGIGFGLALKEEAKGWIKKGKKRWV